jgi:hypothetical protein
VSEVVWPMGMDRDLSTRPLVFNPKGFLVAILENDEACERAKTSLLEAGFDPDDLRVYKSSEILEDHERYLKELSRTRRVVAALTDDQATIDLYFGYAREGRGALWVHVPVKHDASRAMRHLSGHPILHFRYFGFDKDYDIPVHRGST